MVTEMKPTWLRLRLTGLLNRAAEFPDSNALADKIFEVFRNPTPGMLEAGRRDPMPESKTEDMSDIEHIGSADCDVNPIRANSKTRLRYQAMIDAASGPMT